MNKKIGSRNFGKNVYKWKKNLIWLTFLLPTFICLLILTYIPTIKAVNYSFHDVNVIGEIQSNVGFQNYKVLLESSGFRKSILNTLITGNSFGICDCLWCKRGKEQKGTNGIPAWILYA